MQSSNISVPFLTSNISLISYISVRVPEFVQERTNVLKNEYKFQLNNLD